MANKSTLYVLLAFVSFLLNLAKIHATSGAFYADNLRQQSILYKPLAVKDKKDLEEEILHILGLSHRPRPHKKFEISSSGPKYLIDLYETLENDPNLTGKKNASIERDSDVIVSFVNKKKIRNHKAPNLRHERNTIFFFDMTDEALEEELLSAELRVYRHEVNLPSNRTRSSPTLELYTVGETGSIVELVDQITLKPSEYGWVTFNVTGPAILWSAFPERNFGLHLKIKGPSKSEFHDLGISTTERKDKEAFMVAYFKASRNHHIRKTRAAKKPKKHESYYDPQAFNPYYNNMQDTYARRNNCQRLTLYVSFNDLGWQDFIIAPNGYAAFFCHGGCSFPLNAHLNASNHAIVQTLMHLINPVVVPKASCAPTQLSPITVLYFDDNSNVILKKFKNMVVKSCGCR